MSKFGSVASVKALVPDVTSKRAREILTSGKLQNVVFEGEALEEGKGMCEGSSPGDNYQLSFTINLGSSAAPSAHCSCPAATKAALCKHVVALLLKRVEEVLKLEKDGGGRASRAPASAQKEEQATTVEPVTVSAKPAAEEEVKDVEPPVSLTAGALEIATKYRVLPAWMLESPKLKVDAGEHKEKPPKIQKRGTAARKPPPAPQRPRGRKGVKFEEDDEDMDEVGDDAEVAEAVSDEAAPGDRATKERRRGRESPKKDLNQEDEEEEEEEEEEEVHVARHSGRRLRKKGKAEEDEVHDPRPGGILKYFGRGGVRNTSKEPAVVEEPERGRRSSRLQQQEEHVRRDHDESKAQPPETKRGRKPRKLVQEEEEESDYKGLHLTSDDLLQLAQQHLEENKTSLKDDELDREQVETKPDSPVKNKKKSTSMFSSSQWRSNLSQGHPAAEYTPVPATVEQVSDPTATVLPEARTPTTRVEMTQTGIDDMLGMFLPSFRPARSVDTTQSTITSTTAPAPAAPALPDPTVQPRAKKKTSLRDAVKQYL